MSKAVNIIRILLLLAALIGVVGLMRYLDGPQASSQVSFFHTMLGVPIPPKPPSNEELPTPISEVLTKEDKSNQESNESR